MAPVEQPGESDPAEPLERDAGLHDCDAGSERHRAASGRFEVDGEGPPDLDRAFDAGDERIPFAERLDVDEVVPHLIGCGTDVNLGGQSMSHGSPLLRRTSTTHLSRDQRPGHRPKVPTCGDPSAMSWTKGAGPVVARGLPLPCDWRNRAFR